MALFSAATYAEQVAATRGSLQSKRVDALLIFAQESLYYLFGYDSDRYVFFQCAVLCTNTDNVTLIGRRPDVAQATDTSTIDDIRVGLNAEDANPALLVRETHVDHGLTGQVVEIETDNHGYTGAAYGAVAQALEGVGTLRDASAVIRERRLVKSPEEIAVIKRAAELADTAVEAIVDPNAA